MKNIVLETIRNRRTTRSFLNKQITKEELDKIIEAGQFAPSAHNQQSWHFTVVQDFNLLNELNLESKEAAKNFDDDLIQKMANNEKFNVFYNAPTLVVISGNDSSMMPEIDCAAATQNMLIAAESLNIGTCWNGFISFAFSGGNKEKLSEKLRIPKNYTPYYAVALGYKKNEIINAPARKEGTVTYL